MEAVVSPVFQRYVAAPEAVSVEEPPAQNEVGPVITTTGLGNTVMVCGVQISVHPLESVTVTLYVPGVLTTIDTVVSPVVHKYLPGVPVAVRMTESPSQKEIGPLTIITTTGLGCTVTCLLQLLVQPEAYVTVTE
jgi:hypothetical protein